MKQLLDIDQINNSADEVFNWLCEKYSVDAAEWTKHIVKFDEVISWSWSLTGPRVMRAAWLVITLTDCDDADVMQDWLGVSDPVPIADLPEFIQRWHFQAEMLCDKLAGDEMSGAADPIWGELN